MKTIGAFSLILAGLLIAGVAFSQPATAGVSFDFFYSNLSPHGNWVVSGSYGRVWQPSVYHAGWNPYYDGRWDYTDAGWAWESDYAWGAIPYHYGTWSYDPYYGWVWVPGYTWAPAWVVWRTGPGYIGWAPVAPSFSIGLSFHFGDWDDDHFVFVGDHDFMCGHVGSYAVPAYRNHTIIQNTTIINNNMTVVNGVVHNQGPGLTSVERATGRKIAAVPVTQTRGVKALGSLGLAHDAIKVNPAMQARGLKAAQPVSASTPLPKGAARQEGALQARGAQKERGTTAVTASAAPTGAERHGGLQKVNGAGAADLGQQGRSLENGKGRGAGMVSSSAAGHASGFGLPVRNRPGAGAPPSAARTERSRAIGQAPAARPRRDAATGTSQADRFGRLDTTAGGRSPQGAASRSADRKPRWPEPGFGGRADRSVAPHGAVRQAPERGSGSPTDRRAYGPRTMTRPEGSFRGSASAQRPSAGRVTPRIASSGGGRAAGPTVGHPSGISRAPAARAPRAGSGVGRQKHGK